MSLCLGADHRPDILYNCEFRAHSSLLPDLPAGAHPMRCMLSVVLCVSGGLNLLARGRWDVAWRCFSEICTARLPAADTPASGSQVFGRGAAAAAGSGAASPSATAAAAAAAAGDAGSGINTRAWHFAQLPSLWYAAARVCCDACS